MFYFLVIIYILWMVSFVFTLMTRKKLHHSLRDNDVDTFEWLWRKDKSSKESRSDALRFFALGGYKDKDLSDLSKTLCQRATIGFWMNLILTACLLISVIGVVAGRALA